jgi:hypothetical protein
LLNNVTTLTYFPTGPVNTIMGQQNNVTTYTYDSFGRLTASSGSITNPFRPAKAVVLDYFKVKFGSPIGVSYLSINFNKRSANDSIPTT